MFAFSPVVVLGDRSLDRIAVCLGNVYFRLGLLLNLARPFIEQLEVKFPKDLYRLNFEVLLKWRDDNCHRPNMVNGLIETLHTLGKNDVVEIVRDGECVMLFTFVICLLQSYKYGIQFY